MKNPCTECLVKVNCTEICPDKENLRILLFNMVQSYRNLRQMTSTLRKQYKFYTDLQLENSKDIATISGRRFKLGLENPCKKISIPIIKKVYPKSVASEISSHSSFKKS